jgi:hypothetical protein
MGTSVYCRLFVAVEVGEADLLDEVTETRKVLVCHPAADGLKFCPECGKKQKGEHIWTAKVPRPLFRRWLKEKGIGYETERGFEFDDFIHDSYHDTGEVDFIKISTSPEDDDPIPVFGRKVAEIEATYPRKNPMAISFAGLDEMYKEVKSKAAEIGIVRPPELYFMTERC